MEEEDRFYKLPVGLLGPFCWPNKSVECHKKVEILVNLQDFYNILVSNRILYLELKDSLECSNRSNLRVLLVSRVGDIPSLHFTPILIILKLFGWKNSLCLLIYLMWRKRERKWRKGGKGMPVQLLFFQSQDSRFFFTYDYGYTYSVTGPVVPL